MLRTVDIEELFVRSPLLLIPTERGATELGYLRDDGGNMVRQHSRFITHCSSNISSQRILKVLPYFQFSTVIFVLEHVTLGLCIPDLHAADSNPEFL